MKGLVLAALTLITWSCASCSGDVRNEVDTCPVCREVSLLCSTSTALEAADLVITSRQESGCTAILNRQTDYEIRCADQVICSNGNCAPYTFVGKELEFRNISCSPET